MILFCYKKIDYIKLLMIPWNSKKPINIEDIAKNVIQNLFNFNYFSVIIILIIFEITVIMVKYILFLYVFFIIFKCEDNMISNKD